MRTTTAVKVVRIGLILLIIAVVFYANNSFFAGINETTNIQDTLTKEIVDGKRVLYESIAEKDIAKIFSATLVISNLLIFQILLFGGLAIAAIALIAISIVNYFRLYEEAVIDHLTGLYNRRAFVRFLDSEIKRAKRFKHPLSLILLDIDNFKHFNDTHGHPAGDRLLRALALVLKRGIRDIDTVARYGGEEFVIILPEAPHKAVLRIAERLRMNVERYKFPIGKVTISLGLVTYAGPAGYEKEEIIQSADQMLYLAKTKGKNIVEKAHFGGR